MHACHLVSLDIYTYNIIFSYPLQPKELTKFKAEAPFPVSSTSQFSKH